MDLIPFSLEEATDIAEDFEDLIDTDLNYNGAVYEVADVVICPYTDADRKIFTGNYLNTKDKETAISFYDGNEYDVIVYAHDIDDNGQATFIDIRTFAEQKGIQYNYPGKE